MHVRTGVGVYGCMYVGRYVCICVCMYVFVKMLIVLPMFFSCKKI